jgi:hypothetical protein
MSERTDVTPDTPTARALSRNGASGEDSANDLSIEAATCKPKRYIVADPDAPDAPTCKPGRYVVADPDAPDAPTCSGSRYIVAPDPARRQAAEQLPEWARRFGETVAERAGNRDG